MTARILFQERIAISNDSFGGGEECRVDLIRYPKDEHGYSVAVLHMEHGQMNDYGGLKIGSTVERQVRDTDYRVSDAELIRDAIAVFDEFAGKFRI